MDKEFIKNILEQNHSQLIILSILTITTYIPTFFWMINRWTLADTYYSHGLLILLISIFIVWEERKKLSKLKIKPSNFGWIFFISGISIHIVSALWQVYFSSGFSLILVLLGLLLLFLGKDYLTRLLFPICFLTFMIPLPLVSHADVSFRLKILASKASVAIVNSLGVAVAREGIVIQTKHSYLILEDSCSGINSLIAMIALATLMAYYSRMSKPKKIILFLSSVPIPILSNIIRITALTLASEIYGVKFATGAFHEIMGILVFVFAFLGLIMVQNLLD